MVWIQFRSNVGNILHFFELVFGKGHQMKYDIPVNLLFVSINKDQEFRTGLISLQNYRMTKRRKHLQ